MPLARVFTLAAILGLSSAKVGAAGAPSPIPPPFVLQAVDATGTRAELRFTAEALDRAVRDGGFSIPLPDGESVDVRGISTRDAAGLRHLHGITDTIRGPLAVVLTHAGSSLWGTLPDAQGRLWTIATAHGEITLGVDGGMNPSGAALASDVRIPPLAKRSPDASTLSDAEAAMATVDGPVEIDLLGLISRELAGTGTAEAEARARFRHLVEVTNRAFADSEVPAFLRLVGLEVVEIAPLASASKSLDAISVNDPSLGLDVHALRNRLAADLVALIRPYSSRSGACGVAWGNGFGLAPESANPAYGYSVTHLDPCGAYVMAHEIGHNLGAHHDIETETKPDGQVERGAYIDSHGQRESTAPAFHTVMAYPKGAMAWIGRFSDPRASLCEGRACGVEGYANNRRTLALMAPRVATFRSPPGTLHLDVGTITEGDAGSSSVEIRIRHEGPVPAAGLRFTVATRSDTATSGSDFEAIDATTVELTPERPSWTAPLRIIADTIDEPDERFVVVMDGFSDPVRATLARYVLIPDDDPARRVSGRLDFQGAAAPVEPVSLQVVVATSTSSRSVLLRTSLPNHRFQIDVPEGARVLIERMSLPAPFAESRRDWGVVRADVDDTITVRSRVRLRGRLAAPDGVAMPASAFSVTFVGLEGPGSHAPMLVHPPDFAFDVEARNGATPELSLSRAPAPFLSQQRIALGPTISDQNPVVVLRTGAVITGRITYADGAQRPASAPRLWVNERYDTSQNSVVPEVVGDVFRSAVRPDAWVWIDGSVGPGLGAVRDDLQEVVRDVERQYVVRPAPRVGGTTVVKLVEPGIATSQAALIAVPVDRPLPSGGGYAGVSSVGGSASLGTDVQLAGYAEGSDGARHVFVPLTVLRDANSETVETLRLRLDEPLGLALDAHEIEVQVVDAAEAASSSVPMLAAVSDVRVTEGDAGPRTLSIPLSLSRAAPAGGLRLAVGTHYRKGGYGSYAAQLRDDFDLSTSVVEFAAGSTTSALVWTLHGDRAPEVNEAFEFVFLPQGEVLLADSTVEVVIEDDDAFEGLRDDRFVIESGPSSQTYSLDVLGNDALPIGIRYLGAKLMIARPPRNGSVAVDDRGTWTHADDRIVYRSAAGAIGEVDFAYRLCQTFGSPCRSAEVRIAHRPQPFVSGAPVAVTADRGFHDVALSQLPALPDARFEAHGLVAPVVLSQSLTIDPTPESAFDPGGAVTTLRTIAASNVARSHRVFLDARSLSGGDVDVYLGLDANGNGRADISEMSCAATMSVLSERCELVVPQMANAEARYWVLLHSRSGAQNARAEVFEVPVDRPALGRSLAATGPGVVASAANFAVRLVWNDGTLAPGQVRGGWLEMKSDANTSLGWVPVRIERSAGPAVPFALQSGVDHALGLAATSTHETLYLDVPPGATRLDVTTSSAADVDLYLARVDAPVASSVKPTVPVAPARSLAIAKAVTTSGNESLTVANPVPGRWYVTPVNASTATADLIVRATLTATGPQLRPGGYFNPGRSGSGLFLYPAGGAWAGIWYTYLQDGTATWYYLQASAPGVNGIWRSPVFRSAWNGSRNFLTPVGEATVTPRSANAFTFSYTLDGETGSEAYESFGGGCPTFAGMPLNASGHWFDPAKAGTGYSVQMFPNYEFYAVFGYDAQGVPRYLVAERNGIGAATETLTLAQNTGACPLCTRTGNPVRANIGTLTRTFGAGTLQSIQLSGTYTAGVPGTWVANDTVIPLGSLQGCAAN